MKIQTGKDLRDARKLAKLSVADIARKFYVSNLTVYRWENSDSIDVIKPTQRRQDIVAYLKKRAERAS